MGKVEEVKKEEGEGIERGRKEGKKRKKRGKEKGGGRGKVGNQEWEGGEKRVAPRALGERRE